MYNSVKKRLDKLGALNDESKTIVYDFSEIDENENPKSYIQYISNDERRKFKGGIYVDLSGLPNANSRKEI